MRARDEDVAIEPVIQDILIEDGNFSLEELRKAKKSLKDGKQAGPDNIPPKVLKYCNLDDILFEFANDLLNKSKKPKQLNPNTKVWRPERHLKLQRNQPGTYSC